MSVTRVPLFALSITLAVGCYPTHPPPFKLAPLEGRIQDSGSAWDRYSEKDKALLRSGKVRSGLDELAAYIAKGRPAFFWTTQLANGTCSVLLHGAAHDADEVDTAVYTCNGTIEQVVAVDPTLPCWRLAAVAPRIDEKRASFEAKPLPAQWEIVEGILKRGQTSDDVYVAFGKPYNTGVEAREDGTNADTRVYLDSTGESYGLYITLVADKVTGWKIPPDRQLTPEAQKKRLEATEARLMAQLKTMEAKAEQRHQEEVKLLNQLQTRGDEVVKRQTSGLTLAAMFTPVGVLAGAMDATKKVAETVSAVSDATKKVSDNVDTATKKLPESVETATKTLALNKCTFKESAPDGEFGRTCGKGLKACKDGYACFAMVKGRGHCVPKVQVESCKKTPAGY